MNLEMLPFILLSAAATYFPRLIPFLIRGLDRLPGTLALFLKIMPVAALGALIFPGVILDFMPTASAGLFGITVSALIAWLRGGMVVPILASILATFTVMQIF
jgi:branched-subunit amino acid transport protein